MASVFVLNILIAQTFGAALYGQLFYLINSLSFVLLVVSFSLDSGLTYYGSKNQFNSSGIVSFAILWAIVAAIIAVFSLWMYGKATGVFQNYLHAYMYIAGMLLLTFFTAMFTAKHHYVIQNVTIAITNCVLGVLLFFKKDDFTKFTTIFFIAILVQGVVIGLGFLVKYSTSFKLQLPDKKEVKKILKYSSAALLGNVIFFLVYRVDYWILDFFDTSKIQLGNYIQVSKVAQLFFILPSIFASTVFAITAEGKKDDMHLKVQRLSSVLLWIALIMCLPLIFFGKWIFPFVFGSTFVFMYKPFLFLVPGIIFLSAQSPFSAYNAGNNSQKINILGNLFSLIILVIGNFLLIPIYGIAAAAFMSSIGYAFFTIYLFYNFNKLHKMNLKYFLLFSKNNIALFKSKIKFWLYGK